MSVTVPNKLSDKSPASTGSSCRWLRPLRRFAKPVAKRWLGTITHAKKAQLLAALTFDDGPHPRYTPALLDILERHGARATFFCLGRFARQHPEIVRRAALAGHAIGNHTYDHPSLSLVNRKERRFQIRTCAQALGPFEQKIVRPPYGHQSLASRLDLLWLGYQVVTWNVVAEDWLDRDCDWMTEHLLKRISPGCIVLLHDRLLNAPKQRYFDRSAVLETVDRVLAQLTGRYQFVTVPELLQLAQPGREFWISKANVPWLNTLCEEDGGGRRYGSERGRRLRLAKTEAAEFSNGNR